MNELNWKTWLNHGDQYLKVGTPKKERSIFGNEIVYNVLSMSMEGYIMAILDYHHSLPENHTYSDLIYALETVVSVDSNLKERILKYENIQSICSVDKYHTSTPSDADLIDLRGAIKQISKMAHEVCLASEN